MTFKVNGKIVLNTTILPLMYMWEETSYQLERRQTNINCAQEEFNGLKERTIPDYKLTFDPDCKPHSIEKLLICKCYCKLVYMDFLQ